MEGEGGLRISESKNNRPAYLFAPVSETVLAGIYFWDYGISDISYFQGVYQETALTDCIPLRLIHATFGSAVISVIPLPTCIADFYDLPSWSIF